MHLKRARAELHEHVVISDDLASSLFTPGAVSHHVSFVFLLYGLARVNPCAFLLFGLARPQRGNHNPICRLFIRESYCCFV